MNETDTPILQMLETYKAAVWAKDVETLAGLFDPQVCVFDLWGIWSYEGIDAWRAMLTEWLGSLGTERVAVDFDSVRAQVTPGMAVVHAFVRYTGVSAEGENLRSLDNRLTWVVSSRSGEWKIVHEHTSAPVDMDSAKAIFRR